MDEVYNCKCGGQMWGIHSGFVRCAACGMEYGLVMPHPSDFNKHKKERQQTSEQTSDKEIGDITTEDLRCDFCKAKLVGWFAGHGCWCKERIGREGKCGGHCCPKCKKFLADFHPPSVEEKPEKVEKKIGDMTVEEFADCLLDELYQRLAGFILKLTDTPHADEAMK